MQELRHAETRFPSLTLPDPLTNREIEILRMVAGGFNNREIAEALGPSEGTIENTAPASSPSSACANASAPCCTGSGSAMCDAVRAAAAR